MDRHAVQDHVGLLAQERVGLGVDCCGRVGALTGHAAHGHGDGARVGHDHAVGLDLEHAGAHVRAVAGVSERLAACLRGRQHHGHRDARGARAVRDRGRVHVGRGFDVDRARHVDGVGARVDTRDAGRGAEEGVDLSGDLGVAVGAGAGGDREEQDVGRRVGPVLDASSSRVAGVDMQRPCSYVDVVAHVPARGARDLGRRRHVGQRHRAGAVAGRIGVGLHVRAREEIDFASADVDLAGPALDRLVVGLGADEGLDEPADGRVGDRATGRERAHVQER